MKIENICESPVRRKPKSLIVVVTEGCQPVQCYSIGDTLKTVSVPVPHLDSKLVKVTLYLIVKQNNCIVPTVPNSIDNDSFLINFNTI